MNFQVDNKYRKLESRVEKDSLIFIKEAFCERKALISYKSLLVYSDSGEATAFQLGEAGRKLL